MSLAGQDCSCSLTAEAVTLSGEYYRFVSHKRVKTSGPVTVDLLNVLRVGFTRTYSRLKLAIPMALGCLAVLIKALPSIGGYSVEVIPEIWSIDLIPALWSLPFQDFLWKACALGCVFTVPLYWLSYRNDLEINTMQGRYLLPRKGMEAAQIAAFQREFTRLKEERQKAKKSA